MNSVMATDMQNLVKLVYMGYITVGCTENVLELLKVLGSNIRYL